MGDLYGELGVIGATVAGGYAERCLAPASHVFPVPDDMAIEHAATFPTCFLTASHALFPVGRADRRRDRARPRCRQRGVGGRDPARSLCRRHRARHGGFDREARSGRRRWERSTCSTTARGDVGGVGPQGHRGPRRRHGVRPCRHGTVRPVAVLARHRWTTGVLWQHAAATRR